MTVVFEEVLFVVVEEFEEVELVIVEDVALEQVKLERFCMMETLVTLVITGPICLDLWADKRSDRLP